MGLPSILHNYLSSRAQVICSARWQSASGRCGIPGFLDAVLGQSDGLRRVLLLLGYEHGMSLSSFKLGRTDFSLGGFKLNVTPVKPCAKVS